MSSSERHLTIDEFRLRFLIETIFSINNRFNSSDEEDEHSAYSQVNRDLVNQDVEEEDYEPEKEIDTYQNCSVVKEDGTFHCELCNDSADECICCKNCEHKFCRSCFINYTIHNDDKTVCPFCGIDFEYQFAEDHILNNALCKKKQCIICYDWCETDMICCDNCHQPYCLSCFMRMLKNSSEHYSSWKRYSCAYCRNEFSKTFIWVNTPECFHNDYFYIHLHQDDIDEYYKKRERKRIKEQERKYKEEHMKEREKLLHLSDEEWENRMKQIKENSTIKCQNCGVKFEYGVLKSYFKAIFEDIHMNSEHRNENFNLYCPHCKEEWPDEDVYVMFKDYDFLHSIHVFDKEACCICQKRYYKLFYNDYDKMNLDYIDNTCINCGAKFCEDCLKKNNVWPTL